MKKPIKIVSLISSIALILIVFQVVIMKYALHSPYDYSYTFKWIFLFFNPSTDNYANIKAAPAEKTFSEQEAAYKVLLFGDLMYMPGDKIAKADKELQDLFASADFIIGNCEAPVTHKEKNPEAKYLFKFKMPEEYIADFLKDHNVDPKKLIFNLANNHMGDQDADGFYETVQRLAGTVHGTTGYRKKSGNITAVFSLGDLKIGVVGFTQWLNINPFEAGRDVLTINDATAIDWQKIKKEEELDLLFVTPHWDYEFQHYPSSETVNFAHRMIDRGVDFVSGHHPHVIQPVELYKNHIIHYSLGNYFGDVPTWPATLVLVMELGISSDGKIVSYKTHPFVQEKRNNAFHLAPMAKSQSPDIEKIRKRFLELFPG